MERLSGCIAHRGPDDAGWLVSHEGHQTRGRGPMCSGGADAVLLHRRLAIIDLTEAGWQPMLSADGRYAIVFNGEIYNYRELRDELAALGYTFHSQSDTEVLLVAWAAWGRAALTRLTGMFAFALLDQQQRTLVLARDPFGIKPLYYTRWGGGLAFASEIKALLTLPGVSRRAQPERLYQYLRFGVTDHGGGTLFADIRQLPAAHLMELSLDDPAAAHPARYWYPAMDQRADISRREAATELRNLFLESVRLHLRSDVPVGAALSGGIDSSSIVMAMRHLEGQALDLHAFSYITHHPRLREEHWIDLAGAAAGATMHKVCPTPEELRDDLDTLIAIQDEPFASTSIYAQYRMFRLAGEAGIKVMLDGQGADEMLAGYRVYLSARLTSLVRRGQWAAAARFAVKAARNAGDVRLPRLLLETAGGMLPPGLQAMVRRAAGYDLMPDWLNGSWFTAHGVESRTLRARTSRDALKVELEQALVDTSLPQLLRYEDRNSMAFSIESRVPFLTPRLVDFVFSLPEDHLIAGDGTSKAVFRLAMHGLVPDAILRRRDKIGFATPEQEWLDALRPWVSAVLHSEAARTIPALRYPALEAEWQAVATGRTPWNSRFWRWLNVIRWTERFDVAYG